MNVWGFFSSSGVGNLHLIEGNIELNQYKQIILSSISKFFPDPLLCIFQQDNDPKQR